MLIWLFCVYKNSKQNLKFEILTWCFIHTVPEEFQFDPVTRTSGDPSRRPEVRSATIEFLAPADYMVRNYNCWYTYHIHSFWYELTRYWVVNIYFWRFVHHKQLYIYIYSTYQPMQWIQAIWKRFVTFCLKKWTQYPETAVHKLGSLPSTRLYIFTTWQKDWVNRIS